MNINQLQLGRLLTNRSFQICLILGVVLLALLAAYVSDLSAGDLAGRKPPMPLAELQDAEEQLAGRRTPLPRASLPDQGVFMAGKRPPPMPVF